VNRNGQVVSYSQNQSLANRAVLYNDQTGITTDLNTYPLDGGQTPAGLGWTLTSAVSINDFGVMVGYGSNASGNTCWIIYPKCQD
jgi:probable HAF family extracellular repeat protein